MTTFDEFPPSIREAVDGLAWLGHLESTVPFCGHTFTLQTLKAGEELEAALIAQEYQDTYGAVKGQAWAHLAMSVVAVDGDKDFCPPIGPDIRQHGRAKFKFMTENWYWPVGKFLFDEYVKLIQKQSEAMDALEDLSSGSPRNLKPTEDSLTGQENSPATSTSSKSESGSISPDEMRKLASEDTTTS